MHRPYLLHFYICQVDSPIVKAEPCSPAPEPRSPATVQLPATPFHFVSPGANTASAPSPSAVSPSGSPLPVIYDSTPALDTATPGGFISCKAETPEHVDGSDLGQFLEEEAKEEPTEQPVHFVSPAANTTSASPSPTAASPSGRPPTVLTSISESTPALDRATPGGFIDCKAETPEHADESGLGQFMQGSPDCVGTHSPAAISGASGSPSGSVDLCDSEAWSTADSPGMGQVPDGPTPGVAQPGTEAEASTQGSVSTAPSIGVHGACAAVAMQHGGLADVEQYRVCGKEGS